MDFNAMKLVLIGILSLLFLNNVAMGSTVQTTVAPTNPLDNIDTTVETIDVTGPLCNISLTCPSSYCNLHNTKNCTVEVKDGQAVYKCLCQSVFWIVCNGTSNCNFTTKPFPDTNTTDDCEMRFADGYLETKCSSEDMLFDGNDAIVHKLTDCSPFFDTVCTGKFGNNVCDPECDNADCLYDGWDCAENHDDTLDKQLPGGVVIDFARRPKSGKTAYMKVRAENFTTVANVTRFLAGAIAKLPYLIDYVTDVFVCEAGMWNPSTKCSQKCGSTCLPQGDEICHWETGACLHGCNDGFYGGTCSMACPPGCKDTCYVKGTCTCSDGRLWSNQTNSCQCQHGWFGSRCTEKCNSNCEGGGCIEVSGACAMGCISGYYGPDCSKECVGCDNCDEKGTCPLKPEKKTGNGGDNSEGPVVVTFIVVLLLSPVVVLACLNDDSNSDSVVIAIVVVAVLVLCIYVFVVCICKSDCQRAKRRRRGQSGEYPIEDDDDVIKDPVPESEAFLSATGVSGLQPTSPKVGRSKDMIDMDIMEVPAVYDGRKSGPTLEPLQKEPKDGSPESRQPADGASEAEPEAHVNDRGRFASSVVIEVDGKGRLLSITDRDQVPSPSALKEAPDDEVFSVEINDAEKSHDFPHIDEDITPPQSPLGESRAPLASEENILNDLGPRMSVKSGGSEDKNRKGSSRSTSSSSTNSSRKSSSMKSGSRKSSSRTSSSSSHSSRDESNKEHGYYYAWIGSSRAITVKEIGTKGMQLSVGHSVCAGKEQEGTKARC
ncbi:NOTC1-like protein [Mya arenaria]|uniref:NOTC1-like protein n=1 Tax=Mya arenaria TaxID=6604 RepID=A0ABY7FN86_MYAAR|nr:NOTC1-like protein [Mya arenaria]